MLSEDEEPADATSQVSPLLMHWTSHMINCMRNNQLGEFHFMGLSYAPVYTQDEEPPEASGNNKEGSQPRRLH